MQVPKTRWESARVIRLSVGQSAAVKSNSAAAYLQFEAHGIEGGMSPSVYLAPTSGHIS